MVKALFSCWTGPVNVKPVAAKMREAGLEVTCVGTEAVYVASEGESEYDAADAIVSTLKTRNATDFGIEPPHFLRTL